MFSLILEFVGESAVIVIAGIFLVRYTDVLGEKLGMGRSLAGLILLALATSLPELLVGVNAVRLGAVDLAVGDLIGSSLFNLLILAILDLLTKTRGRMLSRTAGAHALSACSSMLLTVLVLIFLLLDSPLSFGRIGVGSLCVAVGYLFSLRLIYIDQQFSRMQETEEFEEKASKIPFGRALFGYLAATAAIFFVAPQLAQTADEISQVTGLGGTFIGTVFVAFVTSLPEATTTFSALRLGAVDMAIGNILGSNSFNMVLFIGLDIAYGQPLFSVASQVHAVTAASVILITCVIVQGMLYRAEKRFWLIEPDAMLTILLVLGSLTMLYFLGVTK